MIVSRTQFAEVVERLRPAGERSVDVEATGLRVYHEDHLFSLIIGAEEDTYYFNFQAYPDLDEEWVLPRSWMESLSPVFANPDSVWVGHKVKYDLGMLAKEGIRVAGKVYDTKVGALIEYNEHMAYGLAECLERIGLKKDDAVETYIAKHGLTEKRRSPYKAKGWTHKFFDRVPFEVMAPYGTTDGKETRTLHFHQKKVINDLSDATPAGLPPIRNVYENEARLVQTTFRMEQVGLRIDPDFCERAAAFERSRIEGAMREFHALTGVEFKNSPKRFAEIFAGERERFAYTDLGNPSFPSEVLETFEHPAARQILTFREAKNLYDFYQGFLYHADSNFDVHPNLNQDGAGHGRFSSSDPNFQNLKKDKEKKLATVEFAVRRAVVPRPGFILVSMDKDQMEYRFLMDRAGEMGIINMILKDGVDVHTATGNLAGVSRDDGKTVNFGLVYGQGTDALAASLKRTRSEAERIRGSVLGAMPNVGRYIRQCINTAKTRGYVFNWFGRRCHFPNPNFAYCAPNYVIAGGCADEIKLGMNLIDQFFLDRKAKSRLIMNVHDENLFEFHESELHLIPEVKRVMESPYPHRHLPLTVGVDYSYKSWADKLEGIPA